MPTSRSNLQLMNRIFAFFLLSLVILPSLSANPVRSGAVEAELIAASDSIVQGTAVDLAIKLKIADHWHVYWKNPGDSGTSVKVKWELPESCAAGELLFPSPKQYETAGFITFGHEGEVLLLASLNLAGKAKPSVGTVIPIKATVSWLACDPSRCVPGRAQLNLKLKVASATKGNANTRMIQTAREALPAPLPAKASADGSKVTLKLSREWKTDWEDAAFFPTQPGIFKLNDPKPFIVRDGAMDTTITLERDNAEADLPTEIQGVLKTPEGAFLIQAKLDS